jgi:hypothetical protein
MKNRKYLFELIFSILKSEWFLKFSLIFLCILLALDTFLMLTK